MKDESQPRLICKFSPDLLSVYRVILVSYFAMRSVNRIIKITFLVNFDWMSSLSEGLVISGAIITTFLSILGRTDIFIPSVVICQQLLVFQNISTEKSIISGTLGEVSNRHIFIISLERKKLSWKQQLRELQVDRLQMCRKILTNLLENPLKIHVLLLCSLQTFYIILQWKKNSSLHTSYKSLLGKIYQDIIYHYKSFFFIYFSRKHFQWEDQSDGVVNLYFSSGVFQGTFTF